MSDVAIPVPTVTFIRLANFLKEMNSLIDPVDAVDTAIEYWIDNARWKKEDLLDPFEPEINSLGYTWTIRKEGECPTTSWFLPNKTLLRVKTRSGYEYAQVKGDKLIYSGDEVANPSIFAQSVAGHPRDAWRDIWVRRPTDNDYIHSYEKRAAIRKALIPND